MGKLGIRAYISDIVFGIISMISALRWSSMASGSGSPSNFILKNTSVSSLVGLTRIVSTPGKYLSTSGRMKGLPVRNSRTFGNSWVIACRALRRPVRWAARDSSNPSIHITTRRRRPIDVFSILRSSETSGRTPPKCLFASSKALWISSGMIPLPINCLSMAPRMFDVVCSFLSR